MTEEIPVKRKGRTFEQGHPKKLLKRFGDERKESIRTLIAEQFKTEGQFTEYFLIALLLSFSV